jgi:predicted dehydrogenase
MTEILRVGIIGCGYWGINYVRVFSELPDAVVAYVCDLRKERLQLVQQRFQGVEVSSSADQLLDDDTIDAVVIATPASAHFQVAKA